MFAAQLKMNAGLTDVAYSKEYMQSYQTADFTFQVLYSISETLTMSLKKYVPIKVSLHQPS